MDDVDMPCSSIRIEDCPLRCARRNGLCDAMLSTLTSTTTITSPPSCPRNCGSTVRGGGACQQVSGSGADTTVGCLSCDSRSVVVPWSLRRGGAVPRPGSSQRAASGHAVRVPRRLPRLPAQYQRHRLHPVPGRPLPSERCLRRILPSQEARLACLCGAAAAQNRSRASEAGLSVISGNDHVT